MNKGSYIKMKWFRDNFVSMTEKILDIGSMDINGSYKTLFNSFQYTGLDIAKGKNVDIVVEYPYDWKEVLSNSYDVVISGHTFEHSEFFWLTFCEMVRVVDKGGILCVIAPNGYREHRYPVDCYRFFTDGMIALARYCELEILHASTNLAPTHKDKDWFSKEADSILVASKPYSGLRIAKDYKFQPVDQKLYNTGFVAQKPKIWQLVRYIRYYDK